MTIYHTATEDIHLVHAGGGPNDDVISTRVAGLDAFRSNWVRCGLRSTWSALADGGTFWRGPLDHMSVSTDDFWLSCQLFQFASQIAQTDLFGFNSGIRRLAIMARAGQRPVLRRYNNDATITTLATGTLPLFSNGRLGRVDIHVNLGTGAFKLYLDHALSLSFTGDLTNSGEYSTITSYDLLGSNGYATFSEISWRSDDTRKEVGVRGIWPYGDGNALDWTGVKADVDEIAVDELDANYTDTVGLIQQYTVPPMPSGLTGNIIVGAVMLGARMATNPTDEAVVIRTGGSDFASTSFDTGGAIEDRMYIWETNPDTTDPFTPAELDDPGFNIGVEST